MNSKLCQREKVQTRTLANYSEMAEGGGASNGQLIAERSKQLSIISHLYVDQCVCQASQGKNGRLLCLSIFEL